MKSTIYLPSKQIPTLNKYLDLDFSCHQQQGKQMDFEEFWKQYPRKVAKRAAQKAWLKLTDKEKKDALEAVKNHKRYWMIKSTASEFMPHPATWLNQGRWEDELDMAIQEKVTAWWASEKGTAEMADKVGCPARPGEDWNTWKTRISEKLKSA